MRSVPRKEVATSCLDDQRTAFGRFVDRCQQLAGLIETRTDWRPTFRRLVAEPTPSFSDREQTIVQTLLLNLFAKGFVHDDGAELAVPPEVLRLLGKRAFREALLRLLEHGAGRTNGRNGRHVRRPAAAVDPRVAQGIKYLQDRCGDPRLSLGDIARQSRLSKWHFNRLLTSTTGAGFRGHLRMARMARARVLLETSTLIIKEIAASVGYTHTSQFSRHFKSRFGVTATRYRHSNRR